MMIITEITIVITTGRAFVYPDDLGNFFHTAPRGGWSSWTDWGPCDRSCTMMRERFCAARDRRKCPGVDPDGLQSQKTRCDTAECNGKEISTDCIAC